jgi:signal transduction histidine kinase
LFANIVHDSMFVMSDQRKFIHDLATPLTTLIFIADGLLTRAQDEPDTDDRTLKDLERLNEVLSHMKDILSDRRELLIRNGET